jgi:CubicO group peptidase (beta-lactamase class C family)
MASFLIFSLCLFLSLSVSALAQQDGSTCPLLGPDFPKPANPAGDQAVIEAQQLLTNAIQQALQTSIADGGLDPNTTSFSLEVYSLHEPEPLLTYHHSAPALSSPAEGVATVDSNTIYRIASVSKLWSVYVYLITAGDTSFNDPITKYVPELARHAEMNANGLATDSIDNVNWNDITVGALAGQLAGIGRDVRLGPSSEQSLAASGLPPVPPSNASYCGNQSTPMPCDRAGTTFPTLLRGHTLMFASILRCFFAQAS